MEWFYADGDNRVGPVDEQALQAAVANGTIRDGTLVWHDGMGDWAPYSTVAHKLGEALVAPASVGGAADPYAAPAAQLYEQAAETAGGLLPSPRSNTIGAGIGWLSAGWAMFKKEPGQWIVTMILIMAIMTGLNFIPILGPIVGNVLYFLMLSGFYLMVAKADRGEPVAIGDVFEGFSHRPWPIVGVMAIYFVATMVVTLVVMGVVFGLMRGGGEPNVGMIVAMFGAMMVVLIPLGMAIAYTPVLLTLHPEVDMLQSMKLSFVGCLKNILPFIVWTLAMIPLSILAAIPIFLGFFVLMPVIMLSMYFSYKEIFLEPA